MRTCVTSCVQRAGKPREGVSGAYHGCTWELDCHLRRSRTTKAHIFHVVLAQGSIVSVSNYVTIVYSRAQLGLVLGPASKIRDRSATRGRGVGGDDQVTMLERFTVECARALHSNMPLHTYGLYSRRDTCTRTRSCGRTERKVSISCHRGQTNIDHSTRLDIDIDRRPSNFVCCLNNSATCCRCSRKDVCDRGTSV